ncbi:MAG: YbaK/EbsC family protein [Gammaproteobacteria bacterium]|nr:YbaK/EbsC family protein [Gammaproteobacteria bacterium]MCW8988475.1 YbaK/EbsC family protein [Gammaproteobacteria bacterium]MCW9030964.1 YbaK/EbsC family protein [Gammaproteobacteria bacterium]
MAIAQTLQKYLAENGVAYETVHHAHTTSSLSSAQAAHVLAMNLAKSVILEDDNGYLMAVIPATEHVKIRKVNHVLNRHLGIAKEAELESLFADCELGAIPAVGKAYSMEAVIDKKLDDCSDIYLEAGDHEELVHIKGRAYRRLMKNSQHAAIC